MAMLKTSALFCLLACCGLAQAAETLLELQLEKTRVWPRQPVAVSVTFLVGQAQVRDIEYPALAGAGFHTERFPPPVEKTLIRDGREYHARVFSTTLTPEQAGSLSVGPAEIGFNRLTEARGAQAFFGAGEVQPERIQSPAVPLEVRPLPLRSRPAEFSGAVGRYRLSRWIEGGPPVPGAAVTLVTRYLGPEVSRWFTCPDLHLPGVRAYPPQVRLEREACAESFPGRPCAPPERLTCRQVLLPEADVTLPALRIAYFDPESGRYVQIASPAIALFAAPAATTSVATSPAATSPPAPAPAPASVPLPAAPARPWWLLLALPALALYGWRRRTRACPAAKPDLSLLEQALNDSPAFHAEAQRLAQALAAQRLNRAAAGLTAADLPEQDALARVLQICDAVRYGGAVSSLEERLRILESLAQQVNPPPPAGAVVSMASTRKR